MIPGLHGLPALLTVLYINTMHVKDSIYVAWVINYVTLILAIY